MTDHALPPRTPLIAALHRVWSKEKVWLFSALLLALFLCFCRRRA